MLDDGQWCTSPFSVYFKTPGEPAGPSDWTEYPDERERITTALADKAADGGNPVTVVGDVHCPFAANGGRCRWQH